MQLRQIKKACVCIMINIYSEGRGLYQFLEHIDENQYKTWLDSLNILFKVGLINNILEFKKYFLIIDELLHKHKSVLDKVKLCQFYYWIIKFFIENNKIEDAQLYLKRLFCFIKTIQNCYYLKNE